MERQPEPDMATREELLAVIAAQQRTIAALERRVADLERRLGSSGGTGMPGNKPAAATRSRASGRPRKRKRSPVLLTAAKTCE